MAIQSITVNLPDLLYVQLQARAQQHRHTVADEVLNLLAAVVPVADQLPEELEQAISPLQLLDDTALWRAAQTRMMTESAQRLENLHHKHQREGLSEDEKQEQASLIHQYERIMLIRAQAAALLKDRGHEVTSLLTKV